MSRSIFQDPSVAIPSLDSELWIMTLRQFLQQLRLQLILPQFITPKANRTNDQVLMDIILHSNQYMHTDKLHLNRCRLYLKAETISDLTNAAGTHLRSSSYFCMEEGVCNAIEKWPYQVRPGPLHRKCWQQFLDTLCVKPTLTLKTPLGNWTQAIKYHWKAYYDPTINSILIQNGNNWHHYSHIVKR